MLRVIRGENSLGDRGSVAHPALPAAQRAPRKAPYTKQETMATIAIAGYCAPAPDVGFMHNDHGRSEIYFRFPPRLKAYLRDGLLRITMDDGTVHHVRVVRVDPVGLASGYVTRTERADLPSA
jgi:hypothetical protein